ncbi:hypothetical protein [Micromonospora echinofusca]|uniref:Uncharacterized protein n=1 Tax=Micromonospora echinofusca TaxID=47858 RepID=A0ABS3VL22_MICEH|nr:hypothetical protein [Micromonospora echinofusca]MBO4205207.1 hypothetical protein [Micromonospora echinofusca]
MEQVVRASDQFGTRVEVPDDADARIRRPGPALTASGAQVREEPVSGVG